MKSIIKTAAVLSSLIIAFGCNSSTDTSTATNASSTAPTSSAGQSAVQDDQSAKNVVQVAIASKDHSTLVTAVKAADLAYRNWLPSFSFTGCYYFIPGWLYAGVQCANHQ